MKQQDTWKDFWNARYSEETFAYGHEPNVFLKAQLALFKPTSILFPAEGEGRNAVYAAQQQWQVSAFDISDAAQRKALLLAQKHGVSLDYRVGALETLAYQAEQFDAIALIYAHFPAAIKSQYHRLLNTYMRPGGYVIFEAFSKNHLSYRHQNPKVGGPQDEASLFSIEEIQADFSQYYPLILEECTITLQEGLYHNGIGSVIRFVGQKKG